MSQSAMTQNSQTWNSRNQPTEQEIAFVGYLRALAKPERPNRAALAALRRGLTNRPGYDLEPYRYLTRHLPDDPSEWDETVYYLVAALFALHQEHWSRKEPTELTNLGASYALLMQHQRNETGKEASSLEQRFVALLNSDRITLPVHLRHAVSLLKAKEIKIDWAQLLHDLRQWDHPNRVSQRTWARTFWANTEAE